MPNRNERIGSFSWPSSPIASAFGIPAAGVPSSSSVTPSPLAGLLGTIITQRPYSRRSSSRARREDDLVAGDLVDRDPPLLDELELGEPPRQPLLEPLGHDRQLAGRQPS